MNRFKLQVFLSVLFVATIAYGEDWLRFRGPNGSGVSQSNLPLSWTPSENVAWKVPLSGAGVSSPIVVGDRVYVTSYSGYGLDRRNPGALDKLQRHLACFSADTGDKLWQKDFNAVQPEDPYTGIGVTAHGYASHTPVSDGERVYVFFGKSGAFAFELDGKQVWHTEIGKESDPWKWGSSASPIVYKDLLIVTASAEGQAIVGLDKQTGQERWRQEAAGLDGMWGTPALVQLASNRTDLVMSVPKEMWGLDPDSGKLRWYCAATGADQAHSSPIVNGETVYALTGRGGGSVAIHAGGAGDVTESNVVWTGRDSTRFASPVAYQENLYAVSNGVASVINSKDGKRVKQTRLRGGSSGGGGRFGGSDYASPVIAGDKLYYVNGKGETFVFELGKDLKQLSVNLVTEESESFGGTPAISNGKMFLRSNKHLYCVADAGNNVQPNASSKFIAKAEPNEDRARAGQRGGFEGNRGGRSRGGRFDPAAIFASRDTNKDKKLTKDEVEGSPTASRFADFDKDNDQAITLQEFQDGIRSMARRGGRGRGGRGGPGRGNDNRPKRPQRPELAS